MKAPVILFVYKRKDKTEKCIKALEENRYVEDTDLVIFADGYKNESDKGLVNDVRDYIRAYQNESRFHKVKIYESQQNKGLANSIINGVSLVMEEYGRAIIVEDDILTSHDFLQYMNEGLDFYEKDQKYGSISAFTYPLRQLKKYKKDIYVTRKGECWGWATWKDRWERVDWKVSSFDEYFSNEEIRKKFDELQFGIDHMLCDWKNGKIDSWAVRWCYHLFINEQLTVYPRISKTMNIGMDGSGTNCGESVEYKLINDNNNLPFRFEFLDIDYRLEHAASIFEKDNIWKKMFWIKQKIMRCVTQYIKRD